MPDQQPANESHAMTDGSLILLPPSEGKAAGGEGPPLNLETLSFQSLNPVRLRMAKALVQLSQRPRSSKKLLGLVGPTLEKAIASNANLYSSPTMPAIRRYTGVMYDSIDYASFDPQATDTFNRNVVIISGLFGAVRPLDMIPEYKLKMGAVLLRRKSCASVWKQQISKALKSEQTFRIIWDFLPLEHSAAWKPAAVPHETRFRIKFVERAASGKLKTITHLSKALKGALVRYLVADPDSMSSPGSALEFAGNFSHPEGYSFRPELATEIADATEIAFVKDTA